MNKFAFLLLAARLVFAANVFQLLQEGSKLSSEAVGRIEELLGTNPNDAEDRIRLIAYWSRNESAPAAESRVRHILWFIEHDPANGVLGNPISRIYSTGPLANPAALEQGRALWQMALQAPSASREIRKNAADWLRFADPETAAALLEESASPQEKGRFLGDALLGITAEEFNEFPSPLEASDELRRGEFARKALERIETSNDPSFVSAAAVALGSDGGILYADGKIDWDYTPLLKRLVDRARALDPNNIGTYTVSTTLPARGERPARAIRVGGNVQQAQLITQQPPRYPRDARKLGIQGSVMLNVLIGPDGRVVRVVPESGPPELIEAAASAVTNWRYKPTTLNRKPVYIITMVQVNFQLTAH